MNIKSTIALFLLSTFIVVSTAHAQMDNETNAARVEKIERDLMLLQRQISRSGVAVGGSSSGTVGSANLEVRLSAIEEQMRDLMGKAEENDFQVKKLTQNLEKMQRDTEFRFTELSQNTLTPAVSQPMPAAKPEFSKADGKPIGKTVDPSTESPQTSNDMVDEDEFATSRDHYNYAFRLLNQTQYDKAAASFANFIKKHPKDPLIGNAYYWQGEILFIRRNYIGAADSFRQGFEELPTGPKAPDNLLKLAMTLNSLNRNKEACVVLTQVVAKFKTTSAAVAQKAEQEQKRIACN